MIEKRVKPNLFTYNLLLRSIRDCGFGDVDVAQDVFHRITEENSRQEYKLLKVNY
jgi:pentatricopeptide repeat domain-containing protein 1